MTNQLTVAELFTPAPSGVGPFGNVPAVPPAGTWLAVMLNIAATVQLPTTAWQPGGPERTILAIEAVTFAESDATISVMAQGGFLQSAASGSVTFTSTNGTTITIPVTPDPSNPAQNPTGALGWLDLLGQNTYDVTRLTATQATGPLAIANINPGTLGPYAAGTYHVANAQTGATYKNPLSLSIPTSRIPGTGGVITGIAPGLSFTIVTTQSAHGLAVNDVVYMPLPSTTGITLASAFGVVTAVTSTTFQVAVSSSGTYTSGGTVYLCTLATMIADVAGIGSNAAPGTVITTVTQNAGVFVSNAVGWSGSNFESNQAYADRCVLSLAARSPNGPAGAYVYFAETAAQILPTLTPPYSLTNGPVKAFEFSSPQTGIVTTVVASATPASSTLGAAVTPGCAQDPITAITNASPAVITVASPSSLAPGQTMTVTISGVLGPLGGVVDGTFLASYVGANQFSIPVDTTSAGSYIGGGSVEGGDLGQIDQLIQNNVVPDNTTAVTESALALPITISATVVVPAAQVAAYKLAASVQLTAQLASYDIGGSSDSVPPNSVAWDDILGALEEAGVVAVGQATYVIAVQALSVSGNSVTATQSGQGVPFPSNQYQAIAATITISVIPV